MPFLNMPFFWFRVLGMYLPTFLLGGPSFREQSLALDGMTGEALVKHHLLVYRRSALFLVLFAVLSSVMAWDWIMSIDVHWFSTLFGWYVFRRHVGGFHDLRRGAGDVPEEQSFTCPGEQQPHPRHGQMGVHRGLFLWTYLYFSQFMLYWYSDIPEEVSYSSRTASTTTPGSCGACSS